MHVTQRFVTVFTTACHMPLSWARWIQYTPSCPCYFFKICFNIVLTCMHRSSRCSLSLRFPCQTLVCSSLDRMCDTCITNFIVQFSHSSCCFILDPNVFLGSMLLDTHQPMFLPITWETRFYTHVRQREILAPHVLAFMTLGGKWQNKRLWSEF